MILRNTALYILALLVLTLSSCHKKNTQFDYNEAVETVHDYVEVQQMTNLLLQTYTKSLTDSTLIADGISVIDGAAVTMASQPSTITFEYYGGAVDDGYDHTRSGKYMASTNGSFTDPSAVISMEFISFSYDGDMVTADEFTMTNSDQFTDLTFDVVSKNISRVYGDTTGIIEFDINQKFTLIKDLSSPYHTPNDSFQIEGSMVGISRNSKNFNSVIADSDIINQVYSCNWMKAGSANVELPDFIHNASVSFYNDGQCMNKYSITTNGALFEKGYDVNY